MDKKALYNALAQHTQTFPDDAAKTWTTAQRIDDILRIKAETDAHLKTLEPVEEVDPAQVAKTEKENNDVESLLNDLKANDPQEFERVRKLSFAEQLTLVK